MTKFLLRNTYFKLLNLKENQYSSPGSRTDIVRQRDVVPGSVSFGSHELHQSNDRQETDSEHDLG